MNFPFIVFVKNHEHLSLDQKTSLLKVMKEWSFVFPVDYHSNSSLQKIWFWFCWTIASSKDNPCGAGFASGSNLVSVEESKTINRGPWVELLQQRPPRLKSNGELLKFASLVANMDSNICEMGRKFVCKTMRLSISDVQWSSEEHRDITGAVLPIDLKKYPIPVLDSDQNLGVWIESALIDFADKIIFMFSERHKKIGIHIDNVHWIYAKHKYTTVATKNSEHLSEEPIVQIEGKHPGYFLKPRRGALVPLGSVGRIFGRRRRTNSGSVRGKIWFIELLASSGDNFWIEISRRQWPDIHKRMKELDQDWEPEIEA